MKIENIVVGDLAANCYILDINSEVLVIDPGDEFLKIKEVINDRKVLGIIITHYHPDHIGALDQMLEYYIVPVYDYKTLEDNNEISNFKFKKFDTFGHSPNSITLFFENEKILFTGDFVFKGTIGRTDLVGGSDRQMRKSLDFIKTFDNDVLIYPGHGEETNIGYEKRFNPYF